MIGDLRDRRLVRPAALALLAIPTGECAGTPAGAGREDVHYVRQTRHSPRIVARRGLARDSREETLARMVEEQGRMELHEDIWTPLLDYLAAAYGPDRRNISSLIYI